MANNSSIFIIKNRFNLTSNYYIYYKVFKININIFLFGWAIFQTNIQIIIIISNNI